MQVSYWVRWRTLRFCVPPAFHDISSQEDTVRSNPIIPLVFAVFLIVAAYVVSQGVLTIRIGDHDPAGAGGNAMNPGVVAEAPADLPPTHTPVPEPTATRQPIPPELQAQIDKIEAQASYMRGLRSLADVPETFLTRAQFREQFKREMQADISWDEVHEYLQELWLLRLVNDPSIDFYEVGTDLYSDAILGYYDHRTKELFVITDKLRLDGEAQITLAHEFVHSLQDQHYKLKKIWPTESTDWDKSMAVRSLVEGDATLSGYGWAGNYMSGGDYRSLFEGKQLSPEVENKTPPYLGYSTIFPYTAGMTFVSQLMGVGYFSSVNLALQDPPRSTEQIIHPEKYLQTPRDHPKSVTLPDLLPALGEPWQFKTSNTLGEFEFLMMLQENGASDPAKGADGWGGAKFALYKLEQEALVYSSTVWDTEADAAQFYGAMYESFAKFTKDGDYWTDTARTFWMRQDGKKVYFIASTNRPALERVVSTMK